MFTHKKNAYKFYKERCSSSANFTSSEACCSAVIVTEAAVIVSKANVSLLSDIRVHNFKEN